MALPAMAGAIACGGPAGAGTAGAPTSGAAGSVGASLTDRPPIIAGDRLAAPTVLRFPGTALPDASVVPVGVTDRGEMEVPVDVGTVGWYRFGPRPGSAGGASVLAGHVDDAVQGPGAFARLAELVRGNIVELDSTDGQRMRFQVVDVRTYTKQSLPVEEMFARTGPGRLHLITCGGPFDSAARSYRDNVVVVATPLTPDLPQTTSAPTSTTGPAPP